jgi:hypothetical protein
VNVKILASQKHWALLTARKLLQEKTIAIENDIRGLLRSFGLKVGSVGKVKCEERINELVEDRADLYEIVQPFLAARKLLREEWCRAPTASPYLAFTPAQPISDWTAKAAYDGLRPETRASTPDTRPATWLLWQSPLARPRQAPNRMP